VLDARGAEVWRATIEPYGRVHIECGERVHQPLRWPGHYADVETGLHYVRFRYYAPELGRFLEADPIGAAGGPNVYAYAEGSPVSRVDVRGLDCAGKEGRAVESTRGRPEEEPTPEQRRGSRHVSDAQMPTHEREPGGPARRRGERIGADGLTAAQRAHFRRRVDAAGNDGLAAAQARYDRNRVARHNEGHPPLTPNQWADHNNRLASNSERGRAQENAALNDLGLRNNNDAAPRKTYPASDGGVTVPDGVGSGTSNIGGENGRGAIVDVKSVPDTRDEDDNQRVVYNTTQLRDQQGGAHAETRPHVTVITNADSDAVRPSRTLGDPHDGSDVVLHRNSETGEWSQWNSASGWEPISRDQARAIVGSPAD
jgi:RHS repeat-associated protein